MTSRKSGRRAVAQDPRTAATATMAWSVSFFAAAMADYVLWLNVLLSTVAAGAVLTATLVMMRTPQLSRMAQWRDKRFSVKAGAAVIYGYALVALLAGVFVYVSR